MCMRIMGQKNDGGSSKQQKAKQSKALSKTATGRGKQKNESLSKIRKRKEKKKTEGGDFPRYEQKGQPHTFCQKNGNRYT